MSSQSHIGQQFITSALEVFLGVAALVGITTKPAEAQVQIPHRVNLTATNPSTAVGGNNFYRGLASTPGETCTAAMLNLASPLNSSPVPIPTAAPFTTTFTDSYVSAGDPYCYGVTNENNGSETAPTLTPTAVTVPTNQPSSNVTISTTNGTVTTVTVQTLDDNGNVEGTKAVTLPAGYTLADRGVNPWDGSSYLLAANGGAPLMLSYNSSGVQTQSQSFPAIAGWTPLKYVQMQNGTTNTSVLVSSGPTTGEISLVIWPTATLEPANYPTLAGSYQIYSYNTGGGPYQFVDVAINPLNTANPIQLLWNDPLSSTSSLLVVTQLNSSGVWGGSYYVPTTDGASGYIYNSPGYVAKSFAVNPYTGTSATLGVTSEGASVLMLLNANGTPVSGTWYAFYNALTDTSGNLAWMPTRVSYGYGSATGGNSLVMELDGVGVNAGQVQLWYLAPGLLQPTSDVPVDGSGYNTIYNSSGLVSSNRFPSHPTGHRKIGDVLLAAARNILGLPEKEASEAAAFRRAHTVNKHLPQGYDEATARSLPSTYSSELVPLPSLAPQQPIAGFVRTGTGFDKATF